MKIAITGSIAFDYIMKYPGEFKEMLLAENLESISVSFLVDELTKQRGGVAANIAYTLALLGERPLLVGTAGKDFTDYRALLEQTGVDTSGVISYNDLYTASFFVNTDQKNNQIASFYGGAMMRARNVSLASVTPGLLDLVVISPNDPIAMNNYIEECKANALLYLYDPSQQVARVSGEEMAYGLTGAFMAMFNEYEYAAICKKTGMSLEKILENVEILVITKGKAGAEIFYEGTYLFIPVFPTDKIVDPTGVGDGFRAGFLKGYAQKWPLKLCGEVGSLAAAYVLEHTGPQTHQFTTAEFVRRFRSFYDDDGFLDQMIEQSE